MRGGRAFRWTYARTGCSWCVRRLGRAWWQQTAGTLSTSSCEHGRDVGAHGKQRLCTPAHGAARSLSLSLALSVCVCVCVWRARVCLFVLRMSFVAHITFMATPGMWHAVCRPKGAIGLAPPRASAPTRKGVRLADTIDMVALRTLPRLQHIQVRTGGSALSTLC